jgi:hypothetical protein
VQTDIQTDRFEASPLMLTRAKLLFSSVFAVLPAVALAVLYRCSLTQKSRRWRRAIRFSVPHSVILKDTVSIETEQGHIVGVRAALMTDSGTGSYETAKRILFVCQIL